MFILSLGAAEAVENYPAKPITVIIPAEAGSDGDILMRPVFQKASEILGKPMVVVNKPGGGNTLGFREVYNAKPDGYTIGMSVTSIASARLLGLLPYDHHGFAPIGLVFTGHPIIYGSVKGPRPFKTMEEVIQFAKRTPGEISIATIAVGGIYWIAAMVLQEGLGIKLNVIPQEGSGGLVITQVAGGHQDIGTSGFSSAKAQIDAGNVRLLAIIGDHRCFGPYSHAPTLKEIGYNLSLNTFGGLIAPRKTPKEIMDKLINTSKWRVVIRESSHISRRVIISLFISPGRNPLSFTIRKKKLIEGYWAKQDC